MSMTLRLPEKLHARATRVADEKGLSLTAWITVLLDEGVVKHARDKAALTGQDRRWFTQDHYRQKQLEQETAFLRESDVVERRWKQSAAYEDSLDHGENSCQPSINEISLTHDKENSSDGPTYEADSSAHAR